MELPIYLVRAVGESECVLSKDRLDLLFITVEITERAGILQGEFQRLTRVVEADEPDWTRKVSRGSQYGDRIGGGTKTDIPNDKFANVILESFTKPELIDVKRLGLGHRPDDGMKCLTVRQRVNAVRAAGESDESVG